MTQQEQDLRLELNAALAIGLDAKLGLTTNPVSHLLTLNAVSPLTQVYVLVEFGDGQQYPWVFHPLENSIDAFELQHGLEMEVRKVGDDWCVYVGVWKVSKTCIKDDAHHSIAMLRRAIVELASLVYLERKRAGAL